MDAFSVLVIIAIALMVVGAFFELRGHLRFARELDAMPKDEAERAATLLRNQIEEAIRLRHRDFRAGQAAFNMLYVLRPDLADQIRGTDLDPFYQDERLPAFYAWLESTKGTP